MKQTTLLAAILLAGPALFAADPQLLSMAPSDANTFAGINVTQAKTSQFGQFLLNSIPQNADIQKFVSETGFDPRTDLSEVLIVASLSAPASAETASSEPSPIPHHDFTSGLFLAKGTFNIAKILAAAATDSKVQVSTYAGVQLVTIRNKMALGLIDAATAVAGDVVSVKAALDRRSGPGSAIDPSIMARINQLSTTEDVWSVSTKGLFGGLPGLGSGESASAILQSIQQTSGGIKFGGNVLVTAQAVAASAQDASSLSDVVKMLSQMVTMHSGPGGVPADVTNLLKSLSITTDGSTLNLSITLPEDELEALLKMAQGETASTTAI